MRKVRGDYVTLAAAPLCWVAWLATAACTTAAPPVTSSGSTGVAGDLGPSVSGGGCPGRGDAAACPSTSFGPAWVGCSYTTCRNSSACLSCNCVETDAGAAWACHSTGGGQTDAGQPNIDPNLDTYTLTNAQLGELCDWTNAQLGGYGKVTPCDSDGGTHGPISVQNSANQAMCVATTFMFRCRLTVGQYEDCILAQVPSGGCSYPQPACS
jgi:hypothetical protein